MSIAAVEQQQIVPAFGWSEQSVIGWWDGAAQATRTVLDRDSGRRVAHRGGLRVRADARHRAGRWRWRADPAHRPALERQAHHGAMVAEFEAAHPSAEYLQDSGNPGDASLARLQARVAARPRSGFAYARAAHVLMPKDFVNLRLTGEVAMDAGDASCSFLMDPRTGRLVGKDGRCTLGLDTTRLPPIRNGVDILGPRHGKRPLPRPGCSRARRSWWAARTIRWRCSARAYAAPVSRRTSPGPRASSP